MRPYNVLVIVFFSLCVAFPYARGEEILTWQECVKEAQKNNPDLISAVEAVKVKEAAKSITASSLYPQVSASAGASTAKTATAGASSTSDSYSYGVNGSQLIFDGFKAVNDVHASSENIKAAKEGYRFTSSGVRFALRTAFIDLLEAQELVKVIEEIVKIRKSNLILVTMQYQSGLEHKGALLTAEANMTEADFELDQAKRSLDFSQRRLLKKMGRVDVTPVSVTGDFTVRETALEKPDFEELVKDNPAVLQSLANTTAQLFNVRSAYGNFAPQLSGQAGALKKSSQWPPGDEQWNVGLSLTMPLFEGGLRTAQASQANALYRQAEADTRSTRDTAVVVLEQTWAGLQDAIETVVVQQKSLEASLERAKVAEAQYSTGFIAFDNWIIIENDLVNAKKSYLQAQVNALLAEAAWVQAKGETLEYEK
jgi:outer membrane protein TolC